jgi:hypothetical protein
MRTKSIELHIHRADEVAVTAKAVRVADEERPHVLPFEGAASAPLLPVDGLGGPLDGVEAFRAPGILHTHLGVFPSQRAGGLNVGEKSVNGLLHGLSIEGELPTCGLLQLALRGPGVHGSGALACGPPCGDSTRGPLPFAPP